MLKNWFAGGGIVLGILCAMLCAGAEESASAMGRVDYLLLSPPDFVDDWTWYVGERKKAHTNLIFAVKNTAEIYDEHPFGGTNACRNAAESIHAYLRAHLATMKFSYVVLGGAWLDAQNRKDTTTYFTTGEMMTLSNCVPGVYGYPREEWREIPSDMFYACLELKNGQRYPWDANENGKYIDQDDCKNNNLWPTVSVSRFTLNPHSGRTEQHNQHALITNYVAKLRRGEAKNFAGHYRYGMSAASTGSSRLRKNVDRMYYRELEFYDGMYNMFDPRHHDTIEDDEYSTRVRYYNQYSMWRPVREVNGMMSYTWTGTEPTLAAAMNDYYASDRDFAYVQAHGWAQGAACFSANRFATATGLTLFNGGSGPCETGYPDYYTSSGGKSVLQYNVGDAAVTNPDGGALASVNNSRWSWAGGGGYGAMSYYMLNQMLIGFNQLRLDVGHAWLKGCQDYWPASHGGGTHTWCLTEQILYGDPLVRLPEVPNVWWTGGETGVWDRVTSNWTNSVDTATTFDAASNVYFTVGTNLSLDVAGEIAAMRLSLPTFEEDAVMTLAGTGTLRVMQAVDVAGTNATLAFGVAGGVGHDGIRFVTGAGDLIFVGTNKFYVGGVRNAHEVALLGGGVTLDVDEFAEGSFPLLIDGSAETSLPLANELRSAKTGGLLRFGPLAMTNSYVKLSTVDAFGTGAPMTHTLFNSELEIAANVYYQRSGFPEGLNATFLVDGDSAVTSSLGGLWTVKHTTTFALHPETCLTLGAETVSAKGRIVITNSFADAACTNTVVVEHANALAGDVTVGDRIRLILKELPLASVTSLTVGRNATVELPDDASGYWQIVPVSSKFNCAEGVSFATASNPTNALAGSPSLTGSFFQEGTLYRWTGEEGPWSRFFANRHPKILFGDLASNAVAVCVGTDIAPEFAFFSNLRTKYVYEPLEADSSLFFDSVSFCGPTDFRVPLAATEYVEISTGTSRFDSVAAPYVHVAAGAGLVLAGSHWTDFRLDADAVLVADPEDYLDWNAETTFAFPDDGQVLVDVGDVALTDEPTPLIAGLGHVWTLSDLQHLRLVQADAEFRIVDGALCVVAGDDLKGPYVLSFAGATNWNTRAWTSNGNVFPKAWGACALDWSADAFVTGEVLTVDCDVHVNTLTVHALDADFTLRASNGFAAIDAVTLDLSACPGETEIGVGTGSARILTSTNENALVHLKGEVAGTLELSGSTVVLDHPGEVTLASGAQGTLRIVAPQGYERFRIAKVPAGFELGGFEIEVTDARGTVYGGFTMTVDNGTLWCCPPALQIEVPAGTNELTRLACRDVFGTVVSNVDWTSSFDFVLIGTATSGVVIAKDGFASVWSRLSVSNEVTIYGNEALAPTQIPGGSGVLALAGGFTMTVDVNANQTLLNGAKIKFLEGTTLELHHRSTNFDARKQDWRGITGTGRVVFADAASSWIALPDKIFADTLSVEVTTDVVLTEGYGTGHRLEIRNLSGAGRFRADWSSGNSVRPVRTVQTGVSAFSGCLHQKCDRTATLIVASDDAAASTNKALILNGAAIEDHALTIEKSGCVILTGSWQGPITVEGLLVITNACATNGLNVTIAQTGEVRLVGADEIPSVTKTPDYVVPEYPTDDPATPDMPVVDARPRILVASVGADSTWSRLDWRGTNGEAVASIDWSTVTNVTLTATNGSARVIFDAEDFTGVVRLAGGVCVEPRALKPFVLTTDSAGSVDFRLSAAPTATTDMLFVTGDASALTNVAVSLRDRYGRAVDSAGEVTFDATNGKYYLNVQAVNRPWVSNTFDTQYDDSLSTSLGFSGSGGLTYKDWPSLFEASRSGRAMKGESKNHFTLHSHNGNPTVSMDSVYSWSINFVVKLPTNDGGIVFGWGNKDSGNGVALVRVRANVAGIYAWKDGGGAQLVASANVPFASSQFHSYAIVHDSHTLSFYVDGVLAQAVSLEGKYPTRGFYQYFKMYGQNGALSDGPTAVVDDFRLYNYCLTPASVRAIAGQFEPWPECPSAEVDVDELAWSDLYWSADYDEDDPLTLIGDGGSLRLDAPVEMTNPLALTGERIPLKIVGDGRLDARGGVTVSTDLEIDVSDLDGNELAKNAVYGAPYSRWLVCGNVAGRMTVSDPLPAMPHGYAVESVVDQHGARLVVTAPWFAKYGSLSFNFAGGDKVANNAGSRVSDQASYKGLSHGAHPILGSAWTDVNAANGTLTTADGVVLAVSGVANAYCTKTSVGDQILYGYLDDSKHPMVIVSNIPYASYRIITYHATDNANTFFCPVWMGATAEDAVRYYGPTRNSSTGGRTVFGWSDVGWGDSDLRGTLAEGINYLVSDVITGVVGRATAYIRVPKLSSGRACFTAFQIVEVGRVYESAAVDYEAVLTNDTTWADGNGAGLDWSVKGGDAWQNDTNSLITLSLPPVTSDLRQTAFDLLLDTVITANVLTVKSAAGERLNLARADGIAHAIDTLDLSSARGEVALLDQLGVRTLVAGADTRLLFAGDRGAMSCTVNAGAVLTLNTNQLFDVSGDTLASGGTVRSLGDIDNAAYATYLPVAGRFGFAHAVITGDLQNPKGTTDVARRTIVVEEGDDVRISSQNKYNCVDLSVEVNGGHLTYLNASVWIGYTASYRQTGGLVTFGPDSGSDTFVPGYTGGGTYTMNISGGTTDVSRMSVKFDQPAAINVSGRGRFAAKGFCKNRDGSFKVTLSGDAVLEVGAGGWEDTAQQLTLAGGTFMAAESCTVKVASALTKPSCLAAANGETLNLTGALTGSGTAALTIGAPGATGDVVVASAAKLGSVVVESGTSVTLPLGAITGDLTLGEGATLNLTASTLADGENPICSGELTASNGVTILLNGATLPPRVRWVEKNLVVDAESRAWANPVTGARVDFTYRFSGTTSGEWDVLGNWQKFGLVAWEALSSGAKVPIVAQSDFAPAVIDGAVISNEANRAVTMAVEMEGWTPRLAVFNGARVTVASINKLQGTPKWFWVDETSQLTFLSFGSASYQDALQLCVAASNGLVFAEEPAGKVSAGSDGTTFEYYLKGEGSVTYAAKLTKCKHAIRRADFTLTPAGIGTVVREKLLVAFPTNSTATFTTTGAEIVLTDPAGELSAGTACGALSAEDAVGSYVVTQRLDGVWLEYVDRAASERFVHEVDYSNDIRRVEIPLDWILQLTNGADRVLSGDDLTAAKVSAALENAGAPNGVKPWESYVLGLEPTNADDRVTADFTFAEGVFRVEAKGLDSTKFRHGVRVKYILEATDDLTKSFETLREAQDAHAFENLPTDDHSKFYRIRVELHW